MPQLNQKASKTSTNLNFQEFSEQSIITSQRLCFYDAIFQYRQVTAKFKKYPAFGHLSFYYPTFKIKAEFLGYQNIG